MVIDHGDQSRAHVGHFTGQPDFTLSDASPGHRPVAGTPMAGRIGHAHPQHVGGGGRLSGVRGRERGRSMALGQRACTGDGGGYVCSARSFSAQGEGVFPLVIRGQADRTAGQNPTALPVQQSQYRPGIAALRQAESTLQDLAELFRVFMRDTRELVPLSAELETCRQYLAIETLRLKPRLEVQWALSNLPMDALVPSLLIQPLIENAVHHGIEPSTEPGLVEVSGQLRVDRIRIEIVNPLPVKGTGPGRMGNQMALSNVRERLMLLFDMEAELRMNTEGDRFRLTLDFPYRPERRGRHE